MRTLIAVILTLVVVLVVVLVVASTIDLAAGPPGHFETSAVTRLKYSRIGGKNDTDPLPDTPETRATGAEHFQHHCEICHGLDGQNTGVPFADKMSPPVADLASARVQRYTDGQLKWIIDNGIRFTGMPGWKGVLEDEESWAIIRYIRHLPTKGSLGEPAVFKEAEEQHEHGAEEEHHHEGGEEHEHGDAHKGSEPHTHVHK